MHQAMSKQPAPPTEPRESLHRSIAQTLRHEIATGVFPVGSMLPGEHELCARFHASRHTVRDSLRQLAAEGLLERRQGAGTRVVSPVQRDNYIQTMQSLDELRQYAADTVLSIDTIKEITLPARVASVLHTEAGTQWLHVTGVRFAGADRICATEVFVHRRFIPLLGDLAPQTPLSATIYTLVATRSGETIAGAEQEIAARPLPRGAANDLGLAKGSPALLFVRRYLDDAGQVMVCSFNWHPADRYIYRMRLQRG
jgi:DNA-binding GntR family transcriptional regulator